MEKFFNLNKDHYTAEQMTLITTAAMMSVITLLDGHAELVQGFINEGADVNAVEDGYTALMMATHRGHTKAAQILIDKGANMNAADKNGDTVLMWAARYGYTELAKILTDKGADVNAADKNGDTALMWAERSGHTEAAQILKDAGATVAKPRPTGLASPPPTPKM